MMRLDHCYRKECLDTVTALRAENAKQAERIREIEAEVERKMSAGQFVLEQNQQLRAENAKLTQERDEFKHGQDGYQQMYNEKYSEIIKLRAENSAQAERIRELEGAIDNELVVAHLGVFNSGDDPKIALNKLECYSQDLGAYFAKEENQQLRDALVKARKVIDCSRHIDASKVAQELDAILSGQPEGENHA